MCASLVGDSLAYKVQVTLGTDELLATVVGVDPDKVRAVHKLIR